MKQIELWRFRYFDAVRKRYSTTSYLLTEQDARIRFPDGAYNRYRTREFSRVSTHRHCDAFARRIPADQRLH